MLKLSRKETWEVLDSLMSIVNQHFLHNNDETISHSYMSTDEATIEMLKELKLAIEIKPNHYKLLWENLKNYE